MTETQALILTQSIPFPQQGLFLAFTLPAAWEQWCCQKAQAEMIALINTQPDEFCPQKGCLPHWQKYFFRYFPVPPGHTLNKSVGLCKHLWW